MICTAHRPVAYIPPLELVKLIHVTFQDKGNSRFQYKTKHLVFLTEILHPFCIFVILGPFSTLNLIVPTLILAL